MRGQQGEFLVIVEDRRTRGRAVICEAQALREAILRRPDAFTTVVTEKMLTYALGRRIEPSDMPVVRRIVKKSAQSNYQLSSIVMGIVESAPFQMRTKLETETVSAANTK